MLKNKILALTIGALLSTPGLTAPSVTIDVTPTNALGSATPVVSWSSAETVTCEASGGWSGTKDTIGSEQLPEVTTTTTYTLTCFGSDGQAVLTWTPPTLRTDGSPLTNLASYNILVGDSPTNLLPYETILAGGTTWTLNNLSSGVKHFAMTAIDADGIESVPSNSVSKDIQPASASNSATITIVTLPNPPILVAVESAAVFEIQTLGIGTGNEIRLGRQIGTIKYDVACGEQLIAEPNYYQVPNEAVQLLNEVANEPNRQPKSEILVAACNAPLTLS